MVFLTITHAVSVVRLIGDSKLVIGVNANGCLSFCNSQGVPRLSPYDSWDGVHHPELGL